MSVEIIIAAAIAVALNFIFLLFKLNREKYVDLMYDALIFFALTFMFSGTTTGLIVSMFAGLIISVYLFFTIKADVKKHKKKKKKHHHKQLDDGFIYI